MMDGDMKGKCVWYQSHLFFSFPVNLFVSLQQNWVLLSSFLFIQVCGTHKELWFKMWLWWPMINIFTKIFLKGLKKQAFMDKWHCWFQRVTKSLDMLSFFTSCSWSDNVSKQKFISPNVWFMYIWTIEFMFTGIYMSFLTVSYY